MTNQKVSVVIPYYQGSPVSLKKTLDSVLRQTYTNFECIVVDDGSDLPFAGLNKSFSDKRFKWLGLKKNYGVAHARNDGIAASNGFWVAFLDAGDWWQPEKIERQVQLLSETGKKWGYTAFMAQTPDGHEIYQYHRADVPMFPLILKKNIISGSASGVLVQRELLDKTGGFDGNPHIMEDWDMWIRLSLIAEPASISETLVNVMILDENSRSSQIDKKLKRFDGIIAKYRQDIERYGYLDELSAFRLQLEGDYYLQNNKPVKGLSAWIKILRVKPGSFPSGKALVGVLAITRPAIYCDIVIRKKYGINFLAAWLKRLKPTTKGVPLM